MSFTKKKIVHLGLIVILSVGILAALSLHSPSTNLPYIPHSSTVDYEMSTIADYTFSPSINARGLHIVGDYAYVVGAGYLVILDISDPNNPSHVGNTTTTVGLFGDVHVVGDYACIGGTTGDFSIVNVSDPVNPTLLDTYHDGGLAWGIFASGNYAYVASEFSGLEIINFTDPTNVDEIGDYDDANGLPYDVQVVGTYAYIADWNYGLEILDITDPTAPTQVAQVANTSDQAWGIYVSGSYAYLADWHYGLRIFDVSNPSSPIELSNGGDVGTAEDVFVVGNYAYLVDRSSMDGLYIYDVSSKTAPYLAGEYDLNEPVYDVEVYNDILYVLGNSKLHILQGIEVVHSYTVSNPGSSTTWHTNTTQDIEWTSTGDVSGTVNIDLYRYDIFLQSIITGTANDGSFSWLIPLELADSNQYQIKITDASDETATGMSSYFEIITPQEKRIPGFSIPFLLGLIGIGIYVLVYRLKHCKN